MAARMEALCGLTVHSLVSNSHLMEDTTAEDVLRGLDTVLEAGKNMNLPVLYATVVPELYEETKSLIEKSSMGKSPGLLAITLKQRTSSVSDSSPLNSRENWSSWATVPLREVLPFL